MLPASHPVWSLARLAIQIGGAALMLWLTATSFDATEAAAIAGIIATNVAAEFLRPKREG